MVARLANIIPSSKFYLCSKFKTRKPEETDKKEMSSKESKVEDLHFSTLNVTQLQNLVLTKFNVFD